MSLGFQPYCFVTAALFVRRRRHEMGKKKWSKDGDADRLLRRLIQNQEIPLDWNTEADTKDYFDKHSVFSQYSHSVFNGKYREYVQGKKQIIYYLHLLNILCRIWCKRSCQSWSHFTTTQSKHQQAPELHDGQWRRR